VSRRWIPAKKKEWRTADLLLYLSHVLYPFFHRKPIWYTESRFAVRHPYVRRREPNTPKKQVGPVRSATLRGRGKYTRPPAKLDKARGTATATRNCCLFLSASRSRQIEPSHLVASEMAILPTKLARSRSSTFVSPSTDSACLVFSGRVKMSYLLRSTLADALYRPNRFYVFFYAICIKLRIFFEMGIYHPSFCIQGCI
jgi:hypothetical protein